MDVYLPIAEMPVNILLIVALGLLGGLLSGIFGVGGGFLMIPLLIFVGIPPAVSVASSSNQIIAASVAGFLTHWRRGNVDVKMGLFLLIGSLFGSSLGVSLFAMLKQRGQLDLAISLIYVLFLGVVGIMMARESWRDFRRAREGLPPVARPRENKLLLLPLPFKVHFPKSDLEVSLLLPAGIGLVVGILVALTGIGGGFLLVPAMIYILGMPTSIVIGTSLFQIIFTASHVTFLQAFTTHTVDIVLSVLLLTGAVIGVHFGTKLGMRLPAERLRGLLALIILVISLRLAFSLFVPPDNPYSFHLVEP